MAKDLTTEDTESTEAATPETDDQPTINAINDEGYAVPCVDIEYARKLERERDEAREKLHRVLKLLDDYDEAIKNPFWDALKKRFTWEAGE